MKRIFYLLAVLLPMFASCEKEDVFEDDVIKGVEAPQTEKTDEYTVTYQYQDEVIVLGTNRLNYLVRVEADTILYFSDATPEEFLPEEGDVISAGISDKTPYGLGNVVIERTEVDHTYRCVTTSASLNQIFKKLKWNANIELLNYANTEGFYDEDGNYIEPKIVYYDKETDTYLPEKEALSRGTVKLDKALEFPIKKDYKKGIGYDSKVTISGFVHCSGDLDEGTLHAYVEPIVSLNATFNVGLEYEKKLDWTKENKMLLLKLENLVTAAIPVGPVMLRPNLDFVTYLQCAASGMLKLELGKSYSFRAGVDQQREDEWYFEDTSEEGEKIIKGLSMDGNIGCELSSLFDLRLGLYTKDVALALMPYVKQTLSADCRMSNASDGDFYFGSSLNYDINVGFNGAILAYLFGNPNWGVAAEFTLLDFNIFHREWPLLPAYVNGSMSVNPDNSGSSLLFDASYNMNGGLLANFANYYPGIVIYKGDEVVVREKYDETTRFLEEMNTDYTLSGLQANTLYRARPSFVYLDKHYEIDEGIEFYHIHTEMPEVTDISRTKAPYYERTYYGNHVVFDIDVEAGYEDYTIDESLIPTNWGITIFCDGQPVYSEMIAKGEVIEEGSTHFTLWIEKDQLNIDKELFEATTEGRWEVATYAYFEGLMKEIHGEKVPLNLVYDQEPSMKIRNISNQRTIEIEDEYRDEYDYLIDRQAWFDFELEITGGLFFDDFYEYTPWAEKESSTFLFKDGITSSLHGFAYSSVSEATKVVGSLYFGALLSDDSEITTPNQVVYKMNKGKPSFSLEIGNGVEP